ncbi:MAG TPA: methyltransferase domain-containing protein [Terracidiphilus sp.]|nr:methyltransferase domain-containing protein [Terracidiphilus sp.]HEV2463244.1 methyltransferase domain-containing protein [Acidobacteriaceae bacterium]
MAQVTEKYYKEEFWATENMHYAQPHFRLEKAARIVNRLARGRRCDLLDVGCGPATLARLLDRNISYHGIDIAIHQPAPNLRQYDFLEERIQFNDLKFDIIVAQGVFEYVGRFQDVKLAEIARLLKPDGIFLASYVNFDHLRKSLYEPYSNVQSFGEFRGSLARAFRIERYFPTSVRWRHQEPKGRIMKRVHMHLNRNIPFVSRKFAVEHFFICRPRQNG